MFRKRNALTIVEVIVVIVVLLLLAALMFPATRDSREAARQNSCMNNIKQTALALINYELQHGHLPPAYTVDADGNRLHSWRTLILPYVEQQLLYDLIDLSQPWDAPANAKARATFMECYSCLSSDAMDQGMTTYVAPVGPNWAFAGETPRSLDDFEDGTSRTVLLVEVDRERAVHWMSPHDFDEADGLPFDKETKGPHASVSLAAFADGHIASIPRDVDPEVLRGMLTIAGGEEPADY